jgi:penicillin-binding protein-related factor A (putative recombinase)
MDRVNELGDASVPFKFDVHTIAFVDDAPKVEKELHNKFSKLRVNTENHRKEFFRVSPDEVKSELDQMGVISDWYFDVEAKEFNESNLIRNAINEHNKSTSESKTLPESI